MSNPPKVGKQASKDLTGENLKPAAAASLPCVLVVDDDPDMIRLLQAALASRGVNCVAASDAKQGFMAAQKHHPRLILVDWHMPAGGGQLMMRHLRGYAPTSGIPVYVVTADGSPAVDAEAGRQGARGVLRKPVDIMELLDLITPQSRQTGGE